MRFTTLGTGTISLTGARSCAAYLLEAADLRLLVDCGSGTAPPRVGLVVVTPIRPDSTDKTIAISVGGSPGSGDVPPVAVVVEGAG